MNNSLFVTTIISSILLCAIFIHIYYNFFRKEEQDKLDKKINIDIEIEKREESSDGSTIITFKEEDEQKESIDSISPEKNKKNEDLIKLAESKPEIIASLFKEILSTDSVYQSMISKKEKEKEKSERLLSEKDKDFKRVLEIKEKFKEDDNEQKNTSN